MKLAIVSDIHGNLEAFQAVLADLAHGDADQRYCLGDLVGYGPNPREVVALAREAGFACVMGNHDQAMLDPAHLSWFNAVARASIEMTAALLDEPSRRFLAGLPFYLVKHGCRFVHGFPPQSARIYLSDVDDERLRLALECQAEDVCFVGHTHELELISLRGDRLSRQALHAGFRTLAEGRHMVNAGSVGQPRDGDRSAKYVIWDTAARRLETRFTPYDAQLTAAKIRALGLPEQNALRLL